ncbi:hypothetical protein [Roseinatronobacter alkalisoli]|uniref:RHS repeat-associated core domain-containing protein n=1 Tax=Roseinatronobacter alkalisoli TaxID=3028235 RepID=A0ABT5TEV2_9RHOB|nr:hypothetical protein [Roseinatronobacter sp. HJB301]MDD7973644.1 hypothetical protein [Roseinatronobacter sp. HJB301]
MFRNLKQLILTTLFAFFASQASAMFIQPDWFDPTQPGVGTNRYSYSFNDPINKIDPNGNEAYDPHNDPNASEGDRIEHELEQARDYFNNSDISVDDRVEYAIELQRRVNDYNSRQSFFDNQAIGFGNLAEVMHKLQNAHAAATGAQSPATAGIATVSTPRAAATPREAASQPAALPPGIGVGQYASPNGGVPASRINRPPAAAERRQVQQQFDQHGCHNCGTRIAGTRSGNPITDHQPPSSLNQVREPQQYYPHCASCSARQGGLLRWFSQ